MTAAAEQVSAERATEMATLGACLLLGESRTASGLLARGLRPEHFYWQTHRDVFTAIAALADRGSGVDHMTVMSELDRLGLRRDISQGFVEELLGHVPAAGNSGAYADRVIELSLWRDRQRALQDLDLAVASRDATRWAQARASLDAAVAGTRTESYSPERWGALLFDHFAGGPENDNAISLPFPRLTRALGGGLWPGEVMVLSGPTSHGKALALTTPVLTTAGWSTMGDLSAGDVVFGADGKPTRVARAHPTLLGSRCYEVEFTDGTTITADEHHLWRYDVGERVHDGYAQRGGVLVRQRHSRRVIVTDTTERLAEALANGTRPPRVPLTRPLVRPEADLPLSPYVLGVWLGDGSKDHGCVTCSTDDVDEMASLLALEGEHPVVSRLEGKAALIRLGRPRVDLCQRGHRREGRWNRCRECAQERMRAASRGRSPDYGAAAWNRPLRSRLAAMGLIGSKRIPGEYLEASIGQRLALLQGLIDTDGSVYAGKNAGSVEFCTTSRVLLESVVDLLLSLGIRVRVYEKALIPGVRGTTRAWRVFFRSDLPVARLGRKLARLRPAGVRRGYRYVRAVRPVPSVPVRCITVEAEDGMFLAGRSLVPTHNSIFADMVLDHAASAGRKCHLYMTEMTAITRGLRYLARRTGVQFLKQRSRDLSESDRQKILAELPRIGYGCTVAADWSVDDIVRDALRARYDIVVVDLLHGFHYEDERGLDRLSKAMQRLARVSTTLDGHPGTAVVAVTHLKEEGIVRGKIPRPTLASIKGGSSIKQDADFVVFVWQENTEGVTTGDGEIWVPKGRSGDLELQQVTLQTSRFRFIARSPQSQLADAEPATTSAPF